MPAIASLADLLAVQSRLDDLKARFPECYGEFQKIFKEYRKVGYKNICKLLLAEATPQKLKGMDGQP
jgi:hypothetical protein